MNLNFRQYYVRHCIYYTTFIKKIICGVCYLDKHFFNNSNHIHFIGIGGSGMYPLAQILHNLGYYLTGSDKNETETLQAVRDMGIPVYLGQRAENIGDADVIVHTAAIMPDNPELIAAKESGAQVLEKSAAGLDIGKIFRRGVREWYSRKDHCYVYDNSDTRYAGH